MDTFRACGVFSPSWAPLLLLDDVPLLPVRFLPLPARGGVTMTGKVLLLLISLTVRPYEGG